MLFGLYGWLRIGGRFALQSLKRVAAAGPAGHCPLAKAMYGTQRDGNAMLVEPLGDFSISPVLAPQRENRIAMWFKFAPRSALLFGFGC